MRQRRVEKKGKTKTKQNLTRIIVTWPASRVISCTYWAYMEAGCFLDRERNPRKVQEMEKNRVWELQVHRLAET